MVILRRRAHMFVLSAEGLIFAEYSSAAKYGLPQDQTQSVKKQHTFTRRNVVQLLEV